MSHHSHHSHGSHHSHSSHPSGGSHASGTGKRRTEKQYRKTLILIAVMLCVLGAVLLVLDRLQEEDGPDSAQETVVINGVTCVPKKNLRTYLFMGIDNTGEDTEEYKAGGQCDTIRLLVVDRTENTYTQLPINRNTLADVDTYDTETGEKLGTSHIQISYAHANAGDAGGPKSCENVVHSVSELLYGQKIDGYLSLGMEAIATVNHLAGGVTVTIEDDFSRDDPSLVMGETLRLSDAQAVHFVRGRMGVGDGTNEGRMRRQNAYVEGLKEQMTQKIKEDQSFPLEVYRSLEAYMVTDMSDKEFSRIANFLTKCESQGLVELEGTAGIDELEFATLELDEDSLAQAVIDLFYIPVDESDASQ